MITINALSAILRIIAINHLMEIHMENVNAMMATMTMEKMIYASNVQYIGI